MPLMQPPASSTPSKTLKSEPRIADERSNISIPKRKSGLSEPYFSIASSYDILWIGSETSAPTETLKTSAIIVSIIDTGGLALAGSVILAFVMMKLIDDSIIQPLVVARSVNMHPLLVLLAVIIGGKFFGILGMLLSVPVTGFAKVALYAGIENFRRYRLT